MKKNYILLISLLMTVTFQSQSLLNEDFNYGGTVGEIGDGSASDVTSGAWSGKGSSGTYVAYVTSSLTMSGYSAGIGGSAALSESSSDDPYSTFTEQTTGEIYYSALVNISSASTGGYFLSLRNTGGSSYRARVYARDNGSGGFNFGVSAAAGTETEVYGTTAFALNTTYLVGVYYNIDTGKVDLHVLDTATNEVEALTSNAEAGAEGQSLLAFGLRQASGVPTATVDAIHVGSSWTNIGLPDLGQVVLSAKTFEIDNFKIFPNPTSLGYINISSKNNRAFKVGIFDILGKQVLKETITNNKVKVSDLNTGVYILKILQDDVEMNKKIVIKN